MLEEVDWSFETLVQPGHTLLVVLAMQNDYCSEKGLIRGGGFSMEMTREMAPRLARFITKSRDAGVLVVHVRSLMTQWAPHAPTIRQYKKLNITRRVTEPGSWGAGWFEEYPEFTPDPQDCVVTTQRYSAFTGTELDLLLRSRGVRTVLFTGITTNGAIEFAARDAFDLDYHVVLVEDCAAARVRSMHDAAIWNFKYLYGNVATSVEILDAWRSLGIVV